MKKRVYSSIIILLVLVAAFAFRLIPTYGVYVFDMLIGALAIVSALEMSRLLEGMKFATSPLMIGIYPSLAFAGHMFHFMFNLPLFWWFVIEGGVLVLTTLITFIAYLFDTGYIKDLRKKYNQGKLKLALNVTLGSLVAFIYPSFILLAFMFANRIDALSYYSIYQFGGNFGWLLLVSAVLVPIVSDTSALLFGKLIKGPKLCEKISPAKTVAGAVSGAVFSSLVMGAMFFLFDCFPTLSRGMWVNYFSVWHFMLFGLVCSIFCQLGDLFESFLKRRANVKDSGNIFPGHGGFLDRIDSHIFSAPVTLLYFCLLLAIY